MGILRSWIPPQKSDAVKRSSEMRVPVTEKRCRFLFAAQTSRNADRIFRDLASLRHQNGSAKLNTSN